ncbi:MAG TPA: hydrogenase formation protein HypD [Geoalkalibacter subterraneus]|uniref:Hydrogenase formation protein HypD n=1 Tax=Geoalkalibacter subterraneus TaxID=483547 RepID=A0A831LSR1_9BACT|nr:hydrogenase formation protein HypD [Geoalkalibacter subterraneus]
MKYLDAFRDREVAVRLLERIGRLVTEASCPMTFMEVCGTHTMAIHQHGIRGLLPEGIRLISGPGCPVCVTPVGYVDHAVALARRGDVIIATFGDMVRVPGSSSSLHNEKARGADVRIVYSPLDAVALARKIPEKKVVFLGVGFETTTPTVAGAVLASQSAGLDNFLILCAHKTIPGPMAVLASDPELQVSGYICPAHVSAIIGPAAYQPLVDELNVPCVITGFEPLDMLQGIEMLAHQVIENRPRTENQYSRIVRADGNPRARAIMEQVFEPCDAIWRGIGEIPASGLRLRDEFRAFDAARQIAVDIEPPVEHPGCLCGEILKGKTTPRNCPLFGTTCTPEDPVGACMVSSEGTCAAEYKYGV